MHHGIGLHGGYAVLIAVAILAASALVAMAVLLLSRKDRPHDRRTTDESVPGDPAPLQEQVLALLHQKGGPVMQGELCRQLNAEPREIARVLHRLEEDHLIERYWQPEKSDYAVLHAEG
jgi:uncharacterized membrane protein